MRCRWRLVRSSMLCLVTGAAVNLAVAWTCTARLNTRDFDVRIVRQTDRPGAWLPDLERLRLHPRATQFSDLVVIVGVEKLMGTERRLAIATPYWVASNSDSGVAGPMHDPAVLEARLCAGWPLPAFEGFRTVPSEPRFPQTRDGRRLDPFDYRDVVRLGSQEGSPGMALVPAILPRWLLPYRPLWTGFGINTLLFAALAWLLLFGPSSLRRLLRRRRGRCERCGYPRGESDRCSECGVPYSSTNPY